MASVLTLSPHDNLGRLCSRTSYRTGSSTPTSTRSAGTVLRPRLGASPASSSRSAATQYAQSWRQTLADLPTRNISMASAIDRQVPRTISLSSTALSTRSAISDTLPQPPRLTASSVVRRNDVTSVHPTRSPDPGTVPSTAEVGGEEEVWFDTRLSCSGSDVSEELAAISIDAASLVPTQNQSFRHWMERLRRVRSQAHRKNKHNESSAANDAQYTAQRKSLDVSSIAPRHSKSDSFASSSNVVFAVKSASVTIASSSLASLKHASRISPRSTGSPPTRIISSSRVRRSIDSALSRPIDEAARKRSQKRREKLQELVRTEEGYLADLKALSNTYSTILMLHSTLEPEIRASIQANLHGLVRLHSALLAELIGVVPMQDSDSSRSEQAGRPTLTPRHRRWKSADTTITQSSPENLVRIRKGRRSLHFASSSDHEALLPGCSPEIAEQVARIFLSKMPALQQYEEFSARCELMTTDMANAQKATLCGVELDRALELLSSSLSPAYSRATQLRKALGLKDLLIKPIQRVTRYELLFKELCQATPVCDDPLVHARLEDLVAAIAQACSNVNASQGDPEKLRLLDNQRILWQRLAANFAGKDSTEQYLSLGRLNLCGALYVAYRTHHGVEGQYAVCMLFDNHILLAKVRESADYEILLAIELGSLSIEDANHGKGLRCNTAPDSLLISYEHQGKIFEVLLVACSSMEASTWSDGIASRTSLETKILSDGIRTTQLSVPSPLMADLKDCGKAYGRGTDFGRRLPLGRAATLGAMKDTLQVVITNVTAVKQVLDTESSASLPISRSQSVANTSHIPVLAPRRSERVRLEQLLNDVWTKDSLPYPGLAPKRSEYNIRGTANSVMRKLSMASIASNFSRRSGGHSSSTTPTGLAPEAKLSKPRPKAKSSASGHSSNNTAAVNFHTAPEAFLPLDFELPDRSKRAKTMTALRALTMTSERPRSPFVVPASAEKKGLEVKRSRSVFGHFSNASQTDQRVFAQTTQTPEPISRRPSIAQQESDGGMKVSQADHQEPSRADTRLTTRRARAMTKLTKLWN